MRYIVCVVVLALCLVVWECTADGGEVSGELGQSGLGAPSASTAPQSGTPGAPSDQKQGPKPQPKVEVKDPAEEIDENEDEGADVDVKNNVDLQGGTQHVVNLPLEIVPKTTTTTTPNKVPSEVPNQHGEDGRLSTLQVHNPLKAPNTEDKLAAQGENTDRSQHEGKSDVKTTTTTAPAPGIQNKASSPTDGKTTTTTAEVQITSVSRGDKVQEQQTPPKDGAAADIKVEDAAVVTTTTTTNAPANTFPKRATIPQSVNNKDSSSSTPFIFAFATIVTLALVSVISVS